MANRGSTLRQGMLVALAAAGAMLALSSCVRLAEQQASDNYTVSDRVVEIRVQNDNGNVTVRQRDGITATEIRRVIEYRNSANKPSGLTHRVEGQTVVLDGCGSNCSVNYEITVPAKDVKVSGTNSSGNVDLQGVGDVDISLNSGNLSGAGINGSFTGQVDSGDISLSDMRGQVNATSDSGSVSIGMSQARSVTAKSSSGDVTVTVPAGSYQVSADANSGEKKVSVPNDSNSAIKLELNSESGNVSLSYN